jgi:hypothetical protein
VSYVGEHPINVEDGERSRRGCRGTGRLTHRDQRRGPADAAGRP